MMICRDEHREGGETARQRSAGSFVPTDGSAGDVICVLSDGARGHDQRREWFLT